MQGVQRLSHDQQQAHCESQRADATSHCAGGRGRWKRVSGCLRVPCVCRCKRCSGTAGGLCGCVVGGAGSVLCTCSTLGALPCTSAPHCTAHTLHHLIHHACDAHLSMHARARGVAARLTACVRAPVPGSGFGCCTAAAARHRVLWTHAHGMVAGGECASALNRD
jgi:hypothetical protein